MRATLFLPILAVVIPALSFTFTPFLAPQSFALAVIAASFSPFASAYVIHPQNSPRDSLERRALEARKGRGKKSDKDSDSNVIIIIEGGTGSSSGSNSSASSNSTTAAGNTTLIDTGAANVTSSAVNSTSIAANSTISADNSTAAATSTTGAAGNNTQSGAAGATGAADPADAPDAATPAAAAPLNLATIVGTGKGKKNARGMPLYNRNLDRRMRRWAEPELQGGGT